MQQPDENFYMFRYGFLASQAKSIRYLGNSLWDIILDQIHYVTLYWILLLLFNDFSCETFPPQI